MIFLFTGFGAAAFGRAFRWYSIGTIGLVFAGGAIAGSQLPKVAAGVIVPGLGLVERTNIYASLLWVAVLAVLLLRETLAQARPTPARHSPAAEPPARKKVLVLNGSPQGGGATFSAAQTFAERLESFGDVDAEVVQLADYSIRTCRGCKVCFDAGEERCPLNDDRDLVLEKLLAADGVVFASPNYSFNISGVLKVFLDRLGFAFHRPRFHGRTYSSIVVQGIYRGRATRKYLDFIGGALGFNVVSGRVIRTLKPMTGEAIARMDRQLAEQAARFHKRLLAEQYPAPSLVGLAAFRMGRTAMAASRGTDNRDFEWYRDHGWLESEYFYPARLGPAKRALGSFFDWLTPRIPTFKVAEDAEDSGAARPAVR
ncbi:MAG: flavodoxin family protein [Coriobacteriales bacterium]|nr:flavodoxin family protein [Coriobacteriales bacterium]